MEIPSIHLQHDIHSTLLQPASCISHLEELAIWFSKRQGKKIPDRLQAAVVLFAADHGVADSIGYQRSTSELLQQATAEDSVISRLCDQAAASLTIVDVGCQTDTSHFKRVEQDKASQSGCADIRFEAAMSQEQYWEAVGIGEDLANRMIAKGANLLVTSSLSTGCTVAVTAILCDQLGLSPEELLASADHEHFHKELIAVEAALARAQGTPSNDILRELGGFEIAAMAGFYRAAARRGVPVLLDGISSATAALACLVWDVRIAGWMLASHVSPEPGHREAIEELGLDPMVEMNKRFNDGKGAVLLVPVLQSALMLQRGLLTIEV